MKNQSNIGARCPCPATRECGGGLCPTRQTRLPSIALLAKEGPTGPSPTQSNLVKPNPTKSNHTPPPLINTSLQRGAARVAGLQPFHFNGFLDQPESEISPD